MTSLRIRARVFVDREPVVNVLPMIRGDIRRIDAKSLNGVDRLQHPFDFLPADQPQQTLRPGLHIGHGRAPLSGRDRAQAAFLDLSGTVAGSVAVELEARKLPNATLVAPLRPMNNIAAPAIAVEIAPPGDHVEDIASAEYILKSARR